MRAPHDVVLKTLKGGSLSFTLGEASARTGLGIAETRDALDHLLRRYACRLRVTDRAEVLYDFGPRLRRVGKVTLKERATVVIRWLGRGFRLVFKLWLTAMLVCYFTVFAVAVVAASVAALVAAGGGGGGGGGGGRRGGRSQGLSPGGLEIIVRTLRSVFLWRTHTDRTYRRQDRRGYPYRRYEAQPEPVRTDRKSFVASVHDFVFGPAPVAFDPLANAREVAAFVRKEKGIVVSSDLVALAGWTAAEADSFLVECILRFEGEACASPGGVVYGQFEQLLRDDGAAGDDADYLEHYWDEYEPEYELTGNDTGRNMAVIALNLANLGFSGAVLSGLLPLWVGTQLNLPGLVGSGVVAAVFGWVPLVFSVLYFLIPLLRWPAVTRANARRVANNLRKRVLKVVFRVGGGARDLAAIVAEINRDHPEEKVTADVVEPMMMRLKAELRGDELLGDDMTSSFVFPALALETAEARTLRRDRRVDRDLGEVVIDTASEEL